MRLGRVELSNTREQHNIVNFGMPIKMRQYYRLKILDKYLCHVFEVYPNGLIVRE